MSLILTFHSIYYQYYQLFDFIVYVIFFTSIFKITLTDFFKKDPPTLVLVATILGLYVALYWEGRLDFRLFDLGAYLFLFLFFIIAAALIRRFIKFSEKSFK